MGAIDGVLRLTEHPLQRCGAWAVTVLAEKDHPKQVTEEDVQRVSERLISHVVIAATAGKGTGAYDWWKVLFALYPNSKPTHSRRERVAGELRPSVAALFAPDREQGARWPCTFCETPCTVVWTKMNLPMFDSNKALNTLPPSAAGWPVCRSCRVAMWALPYGAWLTAGSATVLTSASEAVERSYAAANVRRAGQIRQTGFAGIPARAGPEVVSLAALRRHAERGSVTATLWMFKNDNEQPWLRVLSTRTGVVEFLRRMFADPECRAGWAAMRRRMETRDAAGGVVRSGAELAARTLFDRDGEDAERLPRELWRLARSPERVGARTLRQWHALCRLYLEVMHEMDVSEIRPIAALLGGWIDDRQNPRAKFNEYVGSSANGYDLHKLLMKVAARRYLDGESPVDITEITAGDLFTSGSRGWRLRAQLFFEVLAELGRRKVSGGGAKGEEAEPVFDDSEDPLGAGEEEYA